MSKSLILISPNILCLILSPYRRLNIRVEFVYVASCDNCIKACHLLARKLKDCDPAMEHEKELDGTA